ncbi:MAG: hypothetical protein EPO65_12030 [Dehalococcoidia bacterium]|nr:MAG: hypothetical protein EPO65_12030 [Dehalococcoidia bacterium]
MSLPALRRYQAEIARAILSRIASGEGGSISVEVARQGGKNETSAQVELFTLVSHANTGGTIVKCAPTLRPQVFISLDRLESRAIEAGFASAVHRTSTSLRCDRSAAHFLSAERHANVVGHTADLLLEVDEAQDVDPEKFDRDFRPMAAASNAPVVYYGTPWGPNSLLAQARAHHVALERRGGRRCHFHIDWEQVAASHPPYRQYVEAERERLGERHPLFRTQYLLEEVADAGRMFDPATLAQIEGDYERRHLPQPGERYVAGLDLAGPALDGRVSDDRDRTVLTIARVVRRSRPADGSPLPTVEVVEHQSWQGAPTESLLQALADRLRRVWRIGRLAVDATGLGAPITDLLAGALGRGVVEPVVFTSERKSRLGYGLLAAAHAGRLRLYRQDHTADRALCRAELALARASYGTGRLMQFDVDPSEGHDDYVMSLALAVHAAGVDGGPRVARGRSTDGATDGGVR